MNRFLRPIVFGFLLTAFSAWCLLDVFVIPRVYTTASSGTSETVQTQTQNCSSGRHSRKKPGSSSSSSSSASTTLTTNAVSSDTYYSDQYITVELKEYEYLDSTVYVADVTVTDPSYLKTALAQGVYGKNVTQTTSAMASQNNAVLAVNGDYYGARNGGYVIRGGVLHRDSAVSGREDLVIFEDGSWKIIEETEISAQQLLEEGAKEVLSFGPGLIENGQIIVDTGDEVGKAKASNPRTAIGQYSENHYVFVVSDGRTDESKGLSLYELAQFMESLGVETAYNLDGGGSSTMVFMGRVVNNPTTSGNSIKERSVSDIVYIG